MWWSTYMTFFDDRFRELSIHHFCFHVLLVSHYILHVFQFELLGKKNVSNSCMEVFHIWTVQIYQRNKITHRNWSRWCFNFYSVFHVSEWICLSSLQRVKVFQFHAPFKGLFFSDQLYFTYVNIEMYENLFVV